MKQQNGNADQDGSGAQAEVLPADINLGTVGIYSWLLRVTWNEVQIKKCWGTSKLTSGED